MGLDPAATKDEPPAELRIVIRRLRQAHVLERIDGFSPVDHVRWEGRLELVEEGRAIPPLQFQHPRAGTGEIHVRHKSRIDPAPAKITTPPTSIQAGRYGREAEREGAIPRREETRPVAIRGNTETTRTMTTRPK